jgi:hypothetical protein
VLKASFLFEKIKKQEFSNFENLQFVKNTKFSKFSQNLSFYNSYVQRKSCYNLHKESQKRITTFGGLANFDPCLTWNGGVMLLLRV